MMTLGDSFGILLVIFLLAFVAESTVEYLVGTPMDQWQPNGLDLSQYKWALIYVSAGVGIGLAFWYGLDLIYLLGQAVDANIPESWVGYLLTGAGIGRGANWLHQLVSEYFPGQGDARAGG